jgi:hypothetical protein
MCRSVRPFISTLFADLILAVSVVSPAAVPTVRRGPGE